MKSNNIFLIMFLTGIFMLCCSYNYGQKQTITGKNSPIDTVFINDKHYPYFQYNDILENIQKREVANEKPCFIYYFTSDCAPCSFEMEMINQLFDEFSGKIEFLGFTIIPKDLVSKYYSGIKYPKFPVISVTRNEIKTGFPQTFIMDESNKLYLSKRGGATTEKARNENYQLYRRFCLKVLQNIK